jgi:hypothetical protein
MAGCLRRGERPGDDKDITKGMLVFAVAVFVNKPGIFLEGGSGVGRVTRPGLAVKPGESAINPGAPETDAPGLGSPLSTGKGNSCDLDHPPGRGVGP